MRIGIPTVWVVEFKDRTKVDITHENKEEARILAKAQRIQEGKSYEIRWMHKLNWA